MLFQSPKADTRCEEKHYSKHQHKTHDNTAPLAPPVTPHPNLQNLRETTKAKISAFTFQNTPE